MNVWGAYRSALRLVTAFLFLASVSVCAQAQEKAPASVEALIYSTMPSWTAHRPEMALDGDKATYFKSAYGMDDGDVFLVLLARPIPVQSVHVVSGDAEGQDLLTNGIVETSADAVHYDKATAFTPEGGADAVLEGKPVQAVRIRLNRGRGISSLVLRDIAITSPTKLTHIQLGPGRGFSDFSQFPDLEAWARKAEQQMEAFWPDTAAMLYSDRFITPNMVQVQYRSGPNVTPVAATGGGVMTVNVAWCRQHPEDTGLTVHEMAHVVQAGSAYNPVWLVEGIADYIRWIKFEPENYRPRLNPATATYHDSYRTTATFLAWCELHYDSRLVTKLNHDVRFGTYANTRFKEYCGKDVDTLWAEFIATYQADPAHIITPVLPPADRPRVLPTVTAGTSESVDLSKAFNARGFFGDGAQFGLNDGFDEGGAAYSAALLGATVMRHETVFKLGKTAAANAVSCRGQVVALPAKPYKSLWLLGAAVEGSQRAQTFTVTYTDGTTDTLTQHFSDWYQPQSFPGEERAVTMPYRNMADGSKDTRVFSLYDYGLALNSAKTVKSLTLPDNSNVKLLAVTLGN